MPAASKRSHNKPERLSEHDPLLRTILDAMPSVVFIVDGELSIHDYNLAASELAEGTSLLLTSLCGAALGCVHHQQSAGGCGTTEFCADCVVRSTVGLALKGARAVRRRAAMTLARKAGPIRSTTLVTASPFQHAGGQFALVVLEDLADMLHRGELVPICSNCKMIRGDEDRWQSLESYFSSRSAVEFTHGVCPTCYEKLYGDL